MEQQRGNGGIGEDPGGIGDGPGHGNHPRVGHGTRIKAIAEGRLIGRIQNCFGPGTAPCQNDPLWVDAQCFTVADQKGGGILKVFYRSLKGVQFVSGRTVASETCGLACRVKR